MWQSKWVALDKRSQFSMTYGTYKNHCLVEFNNSHKYYVFRLNSYRKKNISRVSHINAFEIEFDLAIN